MRLVLQFLGGEYWVPESYEIILDVLAGALGKILGIWMELGLGHLWIE